jgi:hypothetical protein
MNEPLTLTPWAIKIRGELYVIISAPDDEKEAMAEAISYMQLDKACGGAPWEWGDISIERSDQ